eukprot:scaffold102022_cov30-Tisochrysis_lutea.AAC.1
MKWRQHGLRVNCRRAWMRKPLWHALARTAGATWRDGDYGCICSRYANEAALTCNRSLSFLRFAAAARGSTSMAAPIIDPMGGTYRSISSI